MKKSIYRYGLALVFVYILILLIFILIGSLFKNVVNIFNIIAVLWGTVLLCLIPITIIKTLRVVLPEKQTKAIVVFKGVKKYTARSGGARHTYYDMVVTFDFSNGVQKMIVVPQPVFMVLQVGDEGILTYKEKGMFRHFINFQNI